MGFFKTSESDYDDDKHFGSSSAGGGNFSD